MYANILTTTSCHVWSGDRLCGCSLTSQFKKKNVYALFVGHSIGVTKKVVNADISIISLVKTLTKDKTKLGTYLEESNACFQLDESFRVLALFKLQI
jgi:hypothetical protein